MAPPELPLHGGHGTTSRGLVSWNLLPNDARKRAVLAVQMRKLGLTELTQLGGIADNCPSPDLTQGLAGALPFCCPCTVPMSSFLCSSWPRDLTFLSLNQQSFRAEHSYICTSDPYSELEYVLKKEAGCWDVELFKLQVLSGSHVSSQHEVPLGETENTTNKHKTECGPWQKEIPGRD